MASQNSRQFIDSLADFFAESTRTPIMRRPDEYGLPYEDVVFPSLDGVELGIVGIGLLEYRDVIGSLLYAKSRRDTAYMVTGLRSVCLGGDSTLVAMNKHPEEFAHIKAMLLLQPVSVRPVVQRLCENAQIENGPEMFEQAIMKRTSFHLDELSPVEHAKAVRVPTLVVQVHNDSITYPYDVQTIYDNIPVRDKRLFWIEGTSRRFDGYNYLGEHPEPMIEWFNTYMGEVDRSTEDERITGVA